MRARIATATVAAALLAACTAAEGTKGHRPSGLGDLTPTFSHKLEVAYHRQTGGVSTNCFPPALVAILKQLGSEFGRTPTVTSGFRPKAGTSQHAKCKAADIRIPGVSPAKVAAAARRIKGIGGVGTYCHTDIVHVDIGPRRDWKWKCSRRSS